MPLALYGHSFSSYTQKVLIALYENGTPFELRSIGPDTPQHSAEWLQRWPLRKFPLLVDGKRNVAEASIIIEYLAMVHSGPVELIPSDPDLALQARFFDRVFDNYVMTPVQKVVGDRLRPEEDRDPYGVAEARAKLERAYRWLDTNLPAEGWAVGEEFTLVECGAASSLFYADWTHPIPEDCPRVRAYRTRLLARPSVARVVNEARPYRPYFPLGAPDRD